MMHQDESCETCAAWFNDGEDGPGDCRRRIGMRGPISEDHWCFEYVPKVPVRCGECWAWEKWENTNTGQCRHGLPQVDSREDAYLFPVTKGTDWCLKGRKKPVVEDPGQI
jgi:hypothetical protein